VADRGVSRFRAVLGTVRVRTTAAAVIVVGVTLVIAAVAMVVFLRRSLTSDVRSAALLRARVVVDALESGSIDDAVPVDDQEEEFVQVIDASGDVVVSSSNLTGAPPVADLAPGESLQVDTPFEDDPFLAVATSADGAFIVVTGGTLETVTESTAAAAQLLTIGLPLLLLVVGATTWRVAGRALAPVEAMRTEVEAISTKELHRRVPDAPGRDEIARLASTMNVMLARLQKGQQRQRRFVSDASHELRSPVATIRQHAEVAQSHPQQSSMGQLVDVVLAETIRLQRLVDDLLLLARIDEGTLQQRSEAVDLDDLVLEEVERLRATTDLRIDAKAVSAGRVQGDPTQLRKLVRNLVDNASRHARGAVALGLREDEKAVVLTVDDDGTGVPEDDRERIFERFVRLEEARDRDSGGGGLGLAIVAEIAAGHAAAVTVGEGPLGGARFEVLFPVAPGPRSGSFSRGSGTMPEDGSQKKDSAPRARTGS
jgi:signal transduction histidine kinase